MHSRCSLVATLRGLIVLMRRFSSSGEADSSNATVFGSLKMLSFSPVISRKYLSALSSHVTWQFGCAARMVSSKGFEPLLPLWLSGLDGELSYSSTVPPIVRQMESRGPALDLLLLLDLLPLLILLLPMPPIAIMPLFIPIPLPFKLRLLSPRSGRTRIATKTDERNNFVMEDQKQFFFLFDLFICFSFFIV